MYVDFFIDYNGKKYFIEYDGVQHFKHIPFFSKTIKDFELRKKRDIALNKLCENNKEFNLIRIKYTLSKNEIMQKLENIFKIDGSNFTSD